MESLMPRIFCSRCITFDHCRWNGLIIASEAIEHMKPFVEFVTACPEKDIGLGVPRKPIRMVRKRDDIRLMQSETEADVTDAMKAYAQKLLDSLSDIDGFVLKSRSPSCGMKDVKVYPALGRVTALKEKTAGFFADAVLKRFSHIPVEDEGRLTNFRIREHFFTRVFANARLRALMREPSMNALVGFHAQNKFLLMAYHQGLMREMGRVVANHEKLSLEEVVGRYEQGFREAFLKPPRPNNNINVLMHALGHFSKRLSKAEKQFFMDALDRYRDAKSPLAVPVSIVRSFIVRFGEDYLAQQTYFNPYPEDLMELKDSGEGRKY